MLKPGDTIDRYTVEATLGQGGMGCVYLAHDARLDRRVAVKVVLAPKDEACASDEATARLVREARAAAALDHPNAVAIHDVGEIDGMPFIVMELVQGKTLRALIDSGASTIDDKVRWLSDAARALGAAHKRGLVHRDVKPENVMVRDDGMVKVLDFGIAKRSRTELDPSGPTASPALATLTVEGSKIGTPLYMSPEQIRGDALDGRADQFVWAVVAYELITGKVPWRAQNDALAVAAAILTQKPDLAPLEAEASPEVVRVIARALSKDAADRFASMEELVAALAGDEAPRPSAAPRSSTKKAPSPSPSTTALQRFSPDEIREVLERALQRQPQGDDGKVSFDELVEAAREVGVDPEALRLATREARSDASDKDLAEAFKRRQKKKLLQHVASYVIINVALLALDISTGFVGWFIWPAAGWGIGVAMHAISYFLADQDDWKEEWMKEEKKRRKREARSKVFDRAIDDGVSAILSVTRGASRRVRVATDAVRAPVRVDTGGAAREREAEREAEASEDEASRRRRRDRR